MKKGFTLIELLVVISIIGILIGLSVFGLQGARESSRDAKRKTDLELIRSGLEIYKSDCDTYPAALGDAGSALTGTGPDGSPCSTKTTYITALPADPVSSSDYAYTATSPDDNVTYTKYYLCAALEQTPSPTSNPDTLGNCGSCGLSACNYVVTNP